MIKYVKSKEGYKEAVAYLQDLPILGIDTETTGLDPHLNQVLLIQMGNEHYQYVMDVFKLRQLGVDFKEVKEILERETVKKVGHNLVFDYKMLKVNFGIELENVFDTMISEIILTKGAKLHGFGLADVLAKYGLNEDMSKDERKSFISHLPGTEFTIQQIQYAGKDVAFLIPLAKKLYALAKADELDEVLELENDTVLVTGDLEVSGMLLNKTEWEKLALTAITKRDLARAKLMAFVPTNFDPIELLAEKAKEKAKKKRGKQESLGLDITEIIEINFSSPAQVTGFLKEITGKRPQDTNEKTLYRIYRQKDGTLPPVISALLDYREADKLSTTYGMMFYNDNLNPVTGRIHSNFVQLGADSGRYASRNPKNVGALESNLYRKLCEFREGLIY